MVFNALSTDWARSAEFDTLMTAVVRVRVEEAVALGLTPVGSQFEGFDFFVLVFAQCKVMAA